MSPETPAAHLARLQKRFPAWTIRSVERGSGWTAQRRNGHKLDATYAPTLAQLEDTLSEFEARGPHE
jgi:hypothetical protein